MSVSSGDASGAANRIRCLYCGANNFPGTTTCWQCGRPFQAARAGTDAAFALSPAPSVAPSANPASFSMPSVNPALASKAAAALGLIFPYIGLPVGIVFLMLDDPRKTQLGWTTIIWSIVGTVASALVFLPLIPLVTGGLKALIPQAGHGGLPIPGGSGIPGDLNSPDPSLMTFPLPWHVYISLVSWYTYL